MYKRIRELLSSHGVEAASSLFADLGQVDVDLKGGLVITPDRRVFRFECDYHGKTFEEGVFRDWIDLTDTYPDFPGGEQVPIAIHMLARSPQQV